MFGSWVLNKIWIIDLSSALVGMLLSEFIQIVFFKHLNSGVRLLLELYCVILIKHFAFFTNCAKLTMAFTITSLPLNFYTSVSGCGYGFRVEQKCWWTDRFGKKKHRLVDLHTSIRPPL